MKKQDAFGQQLLAQYKDRSVPEIVERNDGFISVGRFGQIYFTDYAQWSKPEKQALKLVKGKVLDIGSGAGRHVLYLQNKGFDVLAMDSSAGALKVCKLRGIKKTKLLPIEKVNQLKPQKFDTVLMLGNNFGLFSSFNKAKIILKKLHQVTSKHSQIIAETSNPYVTDNPVHLNYHRRNKKMGRMIGQIKLRIRFQNLIGTWFDYLLVSQPELKKILKDTGWKLKKIIKTKGQNYFVVINKG